MSLQEITLEALNTESFIDEQVSAIRKAVGNDIAINALSGGVDSSAVTMLGHKALGGQLKTYFIENGLMREGEAEQIDDGQGGVSQGVDQEDPTSPDPSGASGSNEFLSEGAHQSRANESGHGRRRGQTEDQGDVTDIASHHVSHCDHAFIFNGGGKTYNKFRGGSPECNDCQTDDYGCYTETSCKARRSFYKPLRAIVKHHKSYQAK